MSDKAKYKVLEEVEIDGTTHAIDSEVELSENEEATKKLVEEGKIALVKDEDGDDDKDGDDE